METEPLLNAFLADELDRAVSADGLQLLLDYDGTLVPFAATPDAASPDDDLLALLTTLAGCRATSVAIVCGRDRASLEEWFGELPIALFAEHGAHIRAWDRRYWQRSQPPAWRADALRVGAEVCARHGGARLEAKECCVAVHTRGVEASARPLVEEAAAMALAQVSGASVLRGDCVVEARDPTIHKGRAVERLSTAPTDVVLALGDDTTDDDLFGSLPAHAISIAVGQRPRKALHRVASVGDVRALLAQIAAGRRG